jgi:methyl-accepting chemotaxis protein
VILHPGLVMAGLSGSFQAQTGIDAIAGRSSYRIDMVRAPQGIQAVNENVNQSSSASAEMSQNIADNHSAGEMSLSSDQVKISADELQKISSALNAIVGRFKI